MDNAAPKKEWTILIYANGNNELQPEMQQAKKMAEAIGSDENVNVLLQISRETDELVNMLRPFGGFPKLDDESPGTRRYFLATGRAVRQTDLSGLNMADPKTLYEFIKWAAACYPAKRYALVLGGHGYQFVGAMTDYSQPVPYIMGLPGMCSAMDHACDEMGIQLDILVLDVCYFNFIEVLCELGKQDNHAVKQMLTHINVGSIAGMPYDKLIQIVQENSRTDDVQDVVRQLAAGLGGDLIAAAINHKRLTHIKQLYNDLAACYLASGREDTSLAELPRSLAPQNAWHAIATEIRQQTHSLVIASTAKPDSGIELIHAANRPTDQAERIAIYAKLSFAQNNLWTYLLSVKTYQSQSAAATCAAMEPTPLTLRDVYTYISIMNPTLTTQQKREIFKQLLQYKKWSY